MFGGKKNKTIGISIQYNTTPSTICNTIEIGTEQPPKNVYIYCICIYIYRGCYFVNLKSFFVYFRFTLGQHTINAKRLCIDCACIYSPKRFRELDSFKITDLYISV